MEKAADILWNEGFNIIHTFKIDEKYIPGAKEHIRGGNWSKGPYATSGGFPAGAVIVYDQSIVTPEKELHKKHPGLVNKRILNAKNKIRNYFNSTVSEDESCNMIHSADNAHQALDYIKLVEPDYLDKIDGKILELYNSFKTPYPVVKTLKTYTKRAKVEIVDYHGINVVCKTYKSGRERFLNREIEAREIGKELPEMTPIIETGNNYFITKFYNADKDKIKSFKVPFMKKAFCPMWFIKRCIEIILFFREKGYEFIDLHPENFIYDEEEGLRLMDFEFLQKTDNPNEKFKGNLAWYIIPDDFKGDRPVITSKFTNPYKLYWFHRIGLPRVFFNRLMPVPVYSLLRILFSLFSIPYIGLRNFYRFALNRK